MSDNHTLKLKVIGQQTIHCNGCERNVEFTLSHLPGVRVVKADHNTQEIEIALTGEETDLEKIKAELEWIGYEAVAA
jgi:copper chaperone CopZ